jgi:prepilin-type N-terminal cleavage/methylation domain-containing protein
MNKKGFTLIEVLTGIFLVSIIFLAFYGMYRLNLIVVDQSKSRIIATAIATGEIEKVMNLPYESVGIKNGFPSGVLESSTTTLKNGINFLIETRVDHVVDTADGLAFPEDSCPNDYKRVEVKVSWSGRVMGQVIFVTDVAPKNLAEECSTDGGILSVSVFDAFGQMVGAPSIEIENPDTGESITSFYPFGGSHYFSLATSTYRVLVSSPGYSSARTYSTDEVTTPDKPDPLILKGKLTELSFSIDKLSNLSVSAISPWGAGYFSDSFLNEDNLSEKLDLVIKNSMAELATDTSGYLPSGYLISSEISPSGLISWKEFSFLDSKPIGTSLIYKIYFATDTLWNLVPDSVLPGNSSGLGPSPIDLSFLSAADYPKLKTRADLTSVAFEATPSLYEWQISWSDDQLTYVPNARFNLRGDKTIGKDSSDQLVYKYSISTTTDSAGHKEFSGLEWDLYTFSVDISYGLDLVNIVPSPQPVDLPPDSSVDVELYFNSANSLLITLQDAINLEPILSASIRAYNVGLGYDNTQYTDSSGQAYFMPLDSGNYNLEISASNHFATSVVISVSGDEMKNIKLEQE